MPLTKITSVNYPVAKKEIAAGDLLPFYFICGEETFFVDSLQNDLIKVMPVDLRDFNMDIFYGNETTLSKVINAAKSYPMMADRRIVVLREFSALFERNKEELEDSESDEEGGSSSVDELIAYIERPNQSTIFIITDKKALGNSRLGKVIEKSNHACYAKFEPITENILPDWIIKWTQFHHNRTLEPQAALLLVQRIGSDLLAITSEIEKFSTSKKENESITLNDVTEHVRVTKEINAFDFKDAIISGNTQKSLKMAEQMLMTTKTSETGEIMRLIAFLYGYYSNIWQIQRLTQKGIPSKQIQATVGIKSEYYFNNLSKESRSFTPAKIHLAFEAILDADKAAKGFTKLEPSDILYMLIRRLTA
ncbi:MAG TPA: DNA polymerase III subunit delta [Bacteroidetes bacterium]|nr:DNA polymerase III subunit delta [Bacteroidota bacterium]